MTEKKTVVYDRPSGAPEVEDIPPEVRATLRVASGPASGREHVLATGQTRVGRGELAELTVDDDSMSRNHFEILHRKSGFRLRDLDSSNGTFLNGSEVEEYSLRDGDKIVAGETLFTFHLEHTAGGG